MKRKINLVLNQEEYILFQELVKSYKLLQEVVDDVGTSLSDEGTTMVETRLETENSRHLVIDRLNRVVNSLRYDGESDMKLQVHGLEISYIVEAIDEYRKITPEREKQLRALRKRFARYRNLYKQEEFLRLSEKEKCCTLIAQYKINRSKVIKRSVQLELSVEEANYLLDAVDVEYINEGMECQH